MYQGQLRANSLTLREESVPRSPAPECRRAPQSAHGMNDLRAARLARPLQITLYETRVHTVRDLIKKKKKPSPGGKLAAQLNLVQGSAGH